MQMVRIFMRLLKEDPARATEIWTILMMNEETHPG